MQDEKLFRAKISDFGLSHHMADGQTHVDISQGTEAYLPMEVFQEFHITKATDMYSLGLLMWEIFYGIFWFGVYATERKRKGCAIPGTAEPYSHVHRRFTFLVCYPIRCELTAVCEWQEPHKHISLPYESFLTEATHTNMSTRVLFVHASAISIQTVVIVSP